MLELVVILATIGGLLSFGFSLGWVLGDVRSGWTPLIAIGVTACLMFLAAWMSDNRAKREHAALMNEAQYVTVQEVKECVDWRNRKELMFPPGMTEARALELWNYKTQVGD